MYTCSLRTLSTATSSNWFLSTGCLLIASPVFNIMTVVIARAWNKPHACTLGPSPTAHLACCAQGMQGSQHTFVLSLLRRGTGVAAPADKVRPWPPQDGSRRGRCGCVGCQRQHVHGVRRDCQADLEAVWQVGRGQRAGLPASPCSRGRKRVLLSCLKAVVAPLKNGVAINKGTHGCSMYSIVLMGNTVCSCIAKLPVLLQFCPTAYVLVC